MRHLISVLLANEAGALSRVAGLFSARGYNIESLTVAATQDPTVSRLTLLTYGSDEVIEQINKQLKKLVDVIDLANFSEDAHIEREVLLLKLDVPRESTAAAADEIARFHAQLLDDTPASFTLEFTGTGSEVDEFVAEISQFGRIVELVRTGVGAIGCGDHSLTHYG